MERGAILVALQGCRRALLLIPPSFVSRNVSKLVAAPCGHLPLARAARTRYEAPQHPLPHRARRTRPGHSKPQALRQAPSAAAKEMRGGAVLLPQHVEL